jgi:hypothetical protein
MKKSFVRGTWQKSRAFSPAVITEGASLSGSLVIRVRRTPLAIR